MAANSGLAIVKRGPSLYELEEGLQALLDTEALVTPEKEAEFRADLEAQLRQTVVKRDRVAAFILALGSQAKFAAEEIQRLQARKNLFDRVAERVKGYVVEIIEKLGSDAKGNLRKLEGQTSTMSARACPPSLLILDEALVPLEYKSVTVTMAATDWEACKDRVLGKFPYEVSSYVNNAAVKGALLGPAVPCAFCGGIGMLPSFNPDAPPVQCGQCGGRCSVSPTVAGADLLVGRYTLQVK